MKKLLSYLDLDRPGLEKVKATVNNPEKMARGLLTYYRARTSIKHPVARKARARAKGKIASEEDIAIANDAVHNILIASPVYPRYNFGPEIDWYTNRSPKKDLEWIVQLHRHYSWTPLGKTYWHTGDEKYAQFYVRQLTDWLQKCPPTKKGYLLEGQPAWGRLEVGMRGHSWTHHFNYFLDSPSYTPDLLVKHLNSFYEHALILEKEFSWGNHGLMEAEGLFFIAVTFPEFKKSESWRMKASQHLINEAKKQVLPDGMHYELNFDYHQGAISWFERSLELARLNELAEVFPPNYEKTIEKMYEVLGRCAHPNGCHSMFGDDKQDSVLDTICLGSRRFPNNITLKFLANNSNVGNAPPTTLALSHAGIYSMRSGWDKEAIHLILKCGRDGGWHCQPDNGTFELWAFGRYLMPDSGCYIYHGDVKGRQWFRQTWVHQTLTLNRKDAGYKARLLFWKSKKELDTLVIENNSYKNLKHRRSLFFVRKSFFVFIDDVFGEATGGVDLHFQFTPGKVVFDRQKMSVRTDFRKGANVIVYPLMQDGMRLEEEEGQVSFRYAVKQSRPAFCFRMRKGAKATSLRFVTLVVPYKGRVPEVIKVSPVGSVAPEATRIEFDTVVGEITARVGYDPDHTEYLKVRE